MNCAQQFSAIRNEIFCDFPQFQAKYHNTIWVQGPACIQPITEVSVTVASTTTPIPRSQIPLAEASRPPWVHIWNNHAIKTIIISIITVRVMTFPYHKPSDMFSMHRQLNGPKHADIHKFKPLLCPLVGHWADSHETLELLLNREVILSYSPNFNAAWLAQCSD